MFARSMSKGYVSLKEKIQLSQCSATANLNMNIFTINDHFWQIPQHTDVRKVLSEVF